MSLSRNFADSMSESLKHIVASETLSTVETKGVLVQVSLQVMSADAMIDAANPILGQAPKALNRVSVGIARDKDFTRVMDALVLVAHRFQRIVRDIFISKNRAVRHGPLDNVGHQRCGLRIRHDPGDDSAFAFDHAKNGSFTSPAGAVMLAFARVFVLLQTTVKTFVSFNLAGQFRAIVAFVQHRANLLEYTPCGFIGDAKLPFQLLRTDSAPRAGHQIHRIEPELQRGGRILEDRAAHRMFVMSAKLAAIGRARRGTMMLGYLLAFRAENAVWIEPFNELFKASCIVWIFALELNQGIGAVGNARTYRVIAIDLAHTTRVAEDGTGVKGILTLIRTVPEIACNACAGVRICA